MRQDLSKKILLLFLLGVKFFSTPYFLSAGTEELGMEERIEELRSKAIDPEIIAKMLVTDVETISKKIKLSPEEQEKIAKQMGKLEELVLSKKYPDLYTQSQAQVSLPHIRKLIAQNYTTTPYLNIISAALAKEGIFKRTHYVFYHGVDNVWRVPQDLYRKLYERLNLIGEKVKDFEFIRWKLPRKVETSAQEFLFEEFKRHGLIDDNRIESKAVLLSTNLALFGNVGAPTECTWDYFMKPRSYKKPEPSDFEGVLSTFGISNKYVGQLIDLSNFLLKSSREQTLLQIFIPKEIVDYVSYLSYARGLPADEQLRGWIRHTKERRKKFHKPHRYINAFKEVEGIFRKEQEKNPKFKELLDRIEKGDYSIERLLKVYCNTPWKIDHINRLQARLVFTKNILTTPGIGIKFFRYDNISKEKLDEYNQRLDKIIDQMINNQLTQTAMETK